MLEIGQHVVIALGAGVQALQPASRFSGPAAHQMYMR
jgi:hypothetical protein